MDGEPGSVPRACAGRTRRGVPSCHGQNSAPVPRCPATGDDAAAPDGGDPGPRNTGAPCVGATDCTGEPALCPPRVRAGLPGDVNVDRKALFLGTAECGNVIAKEPRAGAARR
ncbi:MAG: hypothetical protein HY905_06630 [Deltaproteobacteria bacterium]|nr:hypothetical protein [Deltaproteobacteria bacterium]